MRTGVGDRLTASCRYFSREAALRWGAWTKADPSKARVPIKKRLERFNESWDGHLIEGERSIRNFKRTIRIAGSAAAGVTAMHVFFKEVTRAQGPDGSTTDPNSSYERARSAVFIFLHRVDSDTYPSPDDPAMKLVHLWRTYYEELFRKAPADDEGEIGRRTAEAQVLITQALVKLQTMHPSKTKTDAVLSVITKQREAAIREEAVKTLLYRQIHMIAPQSDAHNLSLPTVQHMARVQEAAKSERRMQLHKRRMFRFEGARNLSLLIAQYKARVHEAAEAAKSEIRKQLRKRRMSRFMEGPDLASAVTKQREAAIRQEALESLLYRKSHMIASQSEDAHDLSLLTAQHKARVQEAAKSAMRKQLHKWRMSRFIEGPREALSGSQPGDGTSGSA
ncbi:hypothetical protein ZWY2020_045568 [Hordeum vulgare]|nr:hypothetical protein ZWY2020_045568 [Hordeum vulgare]